MLTQLTVSSPGCVDGFDQDEADGASGSPELKCCSSSVSLSPRSARSMTVCPPAESAQRYEGQGQPIHDHDGNEDRPKDMHAGSLPHEQR